MTFLKDENGQGMVEYVLIIAAVALVAVVAIVALGNRSGRLLEKANEKLAIRLFWY
jgi:pilus assembly protein Flp/PilA